VLAIVRETSFAAAVACDCGLSYIVPSLSHGTTPVRRLGQAGPTFTAPIAPHVAGIFNPAYDASGRIVAIPLAGYWAFTRFHAEDDETSDAASLGWRAAIN
jgi:hypothetical protein